VQKKSLGFSPGTAGNDAKYTPPIVSAVKVPDASVVTTRWKPEANSIKLYCEAGDPRVKPRLSCVGDMGTNVSETMELDILAPERFTTDERFVVKMNWFPFSETVKVVFANAVPAVTRNAVAKSASSVTRLIFPLSLQGRLGATLIVLSLRKARAARIRHHEEHSVIQWTASLATVNILFSNPLAGRNSQVCRLLHSKGRYLLLGLGWS